VVVRRSETLLFTSREAPDRENRAVRLAHRAGLIRQFGSGLYAFTPTGERVRRTVAERVREAMDGIGAREVRLPQLSHKEPWERSGRWGAFEGEMFTFENREGKAMCLAPTGEEAAVELLNGAARSHDDLPVLVYQVGRKHRDDHARGGLLRTKEFTMKDAYSFHTSEESLDATYERVRRAYAELLDALGVDFVVADAANSVMGGSDSEEFLAPVESGTLDATYCPAEGCRFGTTAEAGPALAAGDACPDCGTDLVGGEAVEVGHTFKLGARYADAMGLTVDGPDGGDQSVVMGSYGIGVERLVHTLISQHADGDGLRWPETGRSVAPYDVSVIPLDYSGELAAVADSIHGACGSRRTLLFDDPGQSIGERFAESDLLGIPRKVILGNHYRETGEVEIETRDGETRSAAPEAAEDL